MKDAGFSKNSRGLWGCNGKTVSAVIHGFEGIHSDIVPILVEMLKNAGFDGDINFGTDAYQNMADGKPGMYMFGHGASLKNPYAALELFIADTVQPSEQVQAITGSLDIVTANMTRCLMKWPNGSDDPRFEALLQKHWECIGKSKSISQSYNGCIVSLQPDLLDQLAN